MTVEFQIRRLPNTGETPDIVTLDEGSAPHQAARVYASTRKHKLEYFWAVPGIGGGAVGMLIEVTPPNGNPANYLITQRVDDVESLRVSVFIGDIPDKPDQRPLVFGSIDSQKLVAAAKQIDYRLAMESPPFTIYDDCYNPISDEDEFDTLGEAVRYAKVERMGEDSPVLIGNDQGISVVVFQNRAYWVLNEVEQDVVTEFRANPGGDQSPVTTGKTAWLPTPGAMTLLPQISQEDWDRALALWKKQDKGNYTGVVVVSGDQPGLTIERIPLSTPITPKALDAAGWESQDVNGGRQTMFWKLTRPDSDEDSQHHSVWVMWGDDSPKYKRYTTHKQDYTVWVQGTFAPGVETIEQLEQLVAIFFMQEQPDEQPQ